jgi:AraC-like DNA-binding protein
MAPDESVLRERELARSVLQHTVNVLESSLSLTRRLLDLMSKNPENQGVPLPTHSHDADCSDGEQKYQGSAAKAWVALDYIHGHHADSLLTLGCVADAVRLSKWHLARLLRQHTGRCFLAHLHDARLRAAKSLLVDPTLTVKEVARAVGYSSAGALDRQFRRHLAITPSEWRSRQSELLDARDT